MQFKGEGCSGAVGSVCAVKAMQVVVREMRATKVVFVCNASNSSVVMMIILVNIMITIIILIMATMIKFTAAAAATTSTTTHHPPLLLPQTKLKISLTDASGAAATCSDDDAPLRYRLLAMASSCSSSSKGSILSEATSPSFSSIQMATNVVAVRPSTHKTCFSSLHSSALHHYSLAPNPYRRRCRSP